MHETEAVSNPTGIVYLVYMDRQTSNRHRGRPLEAKFDTASRPSSRRLSQDGELDRRGLVPRSHSPSLSKRTLQRPHKSCGYPNNKKEMACPPLVFTALFFVGHCMSGPSSRLSPCARPNSCIPIRWTIFIQKWQKSTPRLVK